MSQTTIESLHATLDHLDNDNDKLSACRGSDARKPLWRAIYYTVKWRWWFAVLLNLLGNGLRITSPLITRLIIEQLILANTLHKAVISGEPHDTLERPKSVGFGVGLAFGLFGMEFIGGLLIYQASQIAAVQGCGLRAAIIDLISRKSMRLSAKARLEMTDSRLTTMISSDTSFLDWVFPATIELPVQPIIIAAGIGLLIYTLGYSALVGLGILLVAAPFQGVMFGKLMQYRATQEKIVDKRVRLLVEVITNIRSVKMYAYERFFSDKILDLRGQELSKLKTFGLVRAMIGSTFNFLPVLAAVVTFVVYGLTGHTVNAAVIFTGLQFFNVLKTPISQLPMIFTALMDAIVGLRRIGEMLNADELVSQIHVDPRAPFAIDVQGDFQFDVASPGGDANAVNFNVEKKKEANEPRPFTLREIDLKVQQGSLVCIVGRVGTGKTALLSGLLNEMKQLRGHSTFNGTISYVPQHAWIQSGTIRDNIIFGSEYQPDRLQAMMDACGLREDLAMLPEGDMTYVGEKGVTLSGGQKQRICVARAAYQTADIVLLDDPLSALDANVGHHLLQNCLLHGPLSTHTRLLVTHHLDVLPKANWIVIMDTAAQEGRIAQQGTYDSLCREHGLFRSLISEFGSLSRQGPDLHSALPRPEPESLERKPDVNPSKPEEEEERESGAVSWSVYGCYLRATGSWWWAVLIGSSLILEQAATVGNALFLGFWSDGKIHGLRQGHYMIIYAGLGFALATFTFMASYWMVLAGIQASSRLFSEAWQGVIRSSISWHDRTPSGRIVSRLSKDVQMLDDRLATFWYQFLSNALSVVGTFALIVYTYPYLGLIFIPLTIFFYLCATYYRQTSRELKRLDSVLRSHVYSSFGEQLAGLAVIRAFGKQAQFQQRLQKAVDDQNKAYIVSITCQRWLGVRLEFVSQIIVTMIAVFGAIFRDAVNAAQFGVVLTYALATTAVLTNLVPLFALCEQEMNNVERIQHYTNLELEPDISHPSTPPAETWPTEGAIEFENVTLRYRRELPLVLKGVSFKVRPGEKIGIIGRTGAGKSSITQALFRMTESEGGVWIDGRDIKKLSLETLRSRIAIIPQESFLFEGSVRENLDPLGQRSDAELNDLLQLIRINSAKGVQDKFRLDAEVLHEAANYSAGERQLLVLLRAVARRCKVLVMDEATSSVDPETDAVIQRVIQTQLADATLLSIAHRLQTVAYYDRVLVVDDGKIVESGSPLVLFDDTESLFRKLCDTKQLGIRDILRIRDEASTAASRAQRAAGSRVIRRQRAGRSALMNYPRSAFSDVPSALFRYS